LYYGSQGGIRTPDKVVNSHLLCQLSYLGISISSKNYPVIIFILIYKFKSRITRMMKKPLFQAL
jgi:hypothetical protein